MMEIDTENIIMAIIAAVPPTIAALAAFTISLRTDKKADEIHEIVNSKHDRLLAEIQSLKGELSIAHSDLRTGGSG